VPRIPEDRPSRNVLEYAGPAAVERIAIGAGGDLSWKDIDALATQVRRWEIHRGPVPLPLPFAMVRAIAMVKRVFGVGPEDWRAPQNQREGVIV